MPLPVGATILRIFSSLPQRYDGVSSLTKTAIRLCDPRVSRRIPHRPRIFSTSLLGALLYPQISDRSSILQLTRVSSLVSRVQEISSRTTEWPKFLKKKRGARVGFQVPVGSPRIEGGIDPRSIKHPVTAFQNLSSTDAQTDYFLSCMA